MNLSALSLDLAPSSIEKLARGLPARTQAALTWFPAELRAIFVEPLRAAKANEWPQVFKDVSLPAVRLFLRFSSNVAPLLRDPNFVGLLQSTEPIEAQSKILERLERLDKIASDELLESAEWLRVILAALLADFSVDDLDEVPELDDEQLRQELRGRSGSFLRGELLTIAALEAVLDERPMPDTIVEWCEVACREMNTAANFLRAQGLSIPTEVTIPGFTPKQWRERSRSLVLGALAPGKRKSEPPSGVIERIVEVLSPEEIWLFGSRARRTHRPDSDWDLMAVLPDDASEDKLDIAAVWGQLHELLRLRVEVIPIRRSEFEEERHSPGSLVDSVVREGYIIYGK